MNDARVRLITVALLAAGAGCEAASFGLVMEPLTAGYSDRQTYDDERIRHARLAVRMVTRPANSRNSSVEGPGG